LTREETAAYCAACGIEPLHDETNDSADYARNRVRNELLPLLRSFNPRVEDSLLRLSDAAQEARQRGPVRSALRAAVGDVQGFSARHIEAIEYLTQNGRTGDEVSLPRRLRARRTRDGVVVEASTGPERLPDEAAFIEPGAALTWGPLRIGLLDVKPDGETSVEVDAEAIRGLMVRRRRPGDRIQPSGMQGTRKLQDLFVDVQVPRRERDLVPIFEAERGIVWVGGLRLAEWAKPQPGRPTVWLSFWPVT
jgi:tRNA(Ile)-lysidine synthase